MVLQIVRIGNSKGLRLPKSLLEQFHIGKEVDLQTTKDGLLITPKKSKTRSGWGEKFKSMASHKEDKLLIPDELDIDSQDWKW